MTDSDACIEMIRDCGASDDSDHNAPFRNAPSFDAWLKRELGALLPGGPALPTEIARLAALLEIELERTRRRADASLGA